MMKLEELDEKYGLYKTIDILKDARINIFCKAGGGFLFFTLLIVGYFIDNQNLLFPFSRDYTLIIQYASLIIGFILYAFLHELLHFIAAKITKIQVKFVPSGLFPYTTIQGDITSKKKYFFFVLAPFVLFTLLLIPAVILTKIFAPNWFWLPYIILMQNIATSSGDFVAIFYLNRYHDCFVQDDDERILVYIPTEDFSIYHEKEKAFYEKKMAKKEKKRLRKKRFQDAAKLGKDLAKSQKENPHEDEDSNDLDDLSKLDM